MLTLTLFFAFFLFSLLFPCYSFLYSDVFPKSDDTHVAPAAPSGRVEDISQVADTSAVSGAQVVDIEIDGRVPSLSVVEYKTNHANTFEARRFDELFPEGANSFVFDCRNVRREEDIGVRGWRGTFS